MKTSRKPFKRQHKTDVSENGFSAAPVIVGADCRTYAAGRPYFKPRKNQDIDLSEPFEGENRALDQANLPVQRKPRYSEAARLALEEEIKRAERGYAKADLEKRRNLRVAYESEARRRQETRLEAQQHRERDESAPLASQGGHEDDDDGGDDLAYDDCLTSHTFWLATDGNRPRRVLVIYPWIAAVCQSLPVGRRATAMSVLAQLNYYFRFSQKTGQIRARRVRRAHHIWLAKTRRQLAYECFISETQLRRALEALIKHGFVVRGHWRFNGLRMGHFRLDWDVLQEAAHVNRWHEYDESAVVGEQKDVDELEDDDEEWETLSELVDGQ
jgi:hypothetical protein